MLNSQLPCCKSSNLSSSIHATHTLMATTSFHIRLTCPCPSYPCHEGHHPSCHREVRHAGAHMVGDHCDHGPCPPCHPCRQDHHAQAACPPSQEVEEARALHPGGWLHGTNITSIHHASHSKASNSCMPTNAYCLTIGSHCGCCSCSCCGSSGYIPSVVLWHGQLCCCGCCQLYPIHCMETTWCQP